jgi:hypothetical protein
LNIFDEFFKKDTRMFESIELRKVVNGFVVEVHDEVESKEHVFSNSNQVIKFLKTQLNAKEE